MSPRWACALACLALGLGRPARAQEDACHGTGLDATDELRVTPPDGASQVALDAPIVLAYAPAVDVDALQAALEASDACGGALACLVRASADAGAPERIATALERLDARTVVLWPERRLQPRTRYTVLYARPGFDRPTRGQVELETGMRVDSEPPKLEVESDALDVRVEPPPDACGAPAGSLRVRVSVPVPSDDGDPTSVEVLAYLSRAATRSPPALRARARAEDARDDSITLTLLLSPEEVEGRMCVALRARDGVGRLSQEVPEACFDPAAAERSFFAGSCRVRGGAENGRADAPGAALVGLLAVALGVRRVRARCAP